MLTTKLLCIPYLFQILNYDLRASRWFKPPIQAEMQYGCNSTMLQLNAKHGDSSSSTRMDNPLSIIDNSGGSTATSNQIDEVETKKRGNGDSFLPRL